MLTSLLIYDEMARIYDSASGNTIIIIIGDVNANIRKKTSYTPKNRLGIRPT